MILLRVGIFLGIVCVVFYKFIGYREFIENDECVGGSDERFGELVWWIVSFCVFFLFF